MREPSFIDRRLAVKPSSVHGRGLFATAPIPRGETVIRWGGSLTSRPPKDKTGKVVIQVDDNLWSIEDRDKPEDDTYYLNHSCDSNLWMADGRTFMARRAIKAGEEVTADYALFMDEKYEAAWICGCGARTCRGRVSGKDYLVPEVQKRYQGHFSPLVQKRIVVPSCSRAGSRT